MNVGSNITKQDLNVGKRGSENAHAALILLSSAAMQIVARGKTVFAKIWYDCPGLKLSYNYRQGFTQRLAIFLGLTTPVM